MSNILSIDNAFGMSVQVGGNRAKAKTMVTNSRFIGDTADQPDNCPQGSTGDDCFCPTQKMGLMTLGSNHGRKPAMIKKTSAMPMFKIKSYASDHSETEMNNLVFENFAKESPCGAKQSVFMLNKYQADYIPVQNLDKITFKNVDHASLAYLKDPPEKWNNPDDCIGFPCTAPQNVLFRFSNVKFEGNSQPSIQ